MPEQLFLLSGLVVSGTGGDGTTVIVLVSWRRRPSPKTYNHNSKKVRMSLQVFVHKNIQTIDVIMKPEQSMFILTAGNVTQ